MKCSTCNEEIKRGDVTAIGPDGESHAKCAKRATAHGEEIDLFSLHEQIGMLKKRVQALERALSEHAETLEHHGNNIPFRIGGGNS